MAKQRNDGFPGNSEGENGGALDLSNDRKQKSRVKNHQNLTPASVPGGSQSFKKNLFTPVQKGQESPRDVRTPTPKLSHSVVQDCLNVTLLIILPEDGRFANAKTEMDLEEIGNLLKGRYTRVWFQQSRVWIQLTRFHQQKNRVLSRGTVLLNWTKLLI